MDRKSLSAWTALLALAALPASGFRPDMEKARLELAADRSAYEPGSTARIAALVDIEVGWHVNSHQPTFEFLIPTRVEFQPPEGWETLTVDYPPGEMQTFAFADEPISVYDGQVAIEGQFKVPAGAEAGETRMAARLTYQACNDSQCLPPVTSERTLTLTLGAAGRPAHQELFGGAGGAASSGPTAQPAAEVGPHLALILLLGLVGGLILNAMPCVLPVLSLKVFGLVKSAGEGRRAVVVGSLATAAGILISFWALGAAAVLAKAAGSAVGWGIQFQNPVFVTFLAVVVVLFSLNLWGLFEIPLPGFLTRVGGGGGGGGVPGHFTSGLFATLMATPCSAPFLGTAMGFALAQKAPVILAVFTAVGVGMALPYLTLAVAPGAARMLPRPGAWMDLLKGLMGFLLAGAAIWLLYVLAAQVSPARLAAIELALLALALFVWLRHRAAGSRVRRGAAVGLAAALALTLILPLGARAVGAGNGHGGPAGNGLIAWTDFDRGQAEALAEEGRLVFVDVTADWCFTCKFNEKLVLESPEVAGAFDRHGVVAMRADWTNRNDEIGAYLAEFGRYGIPFYALYRPGGDPHVFSELLTKEAVLAVLRETAGAPPEVARAALGS